MGNATQLKRESRSAIDSLQQTWESGFQIVAAALNSALPKGVRRIKVDKAPTEPPSLERLTIHFWGEARRFADLARDPSVYEWVERKAPLWSAGYPKGNDHSQWLLGQYANSQTGTLALAVSVFATRGNWTKADWKTYITEPVEAYAAEWRAWFDDIRGSDRADSSKLFPKGRPKERDYEEFVVWFIQNRDSHPVQNQVARNYANEMGCDETKILRFLNRYQTDLRRGKVTL